MPAPSRTGSAQLGLVSTAVLGDIKDWSAGIWGEVVVETERFKQQLLHLKVELEEQQLDNESADKPIELDQARLGRLSRMDALQGQQMLQELARRQQAKLLSIDAALRRIEAGDYGDCFVCAEPIDPRRLTVDPTATRCVSCMDG